MAYITRTGNPVVDAERNFSKREDEYRRYIRGNAECCVCGRTIEDDRCYVLDSDETSVCEDCKREQILKARAALAPEFVNLLEDMLSDLWDRTPHKEEEEVA